MATRTEIFTLDNGGPVGLHIYSRESEFSGRLLEVNIRDPRAVGVPYATAQLTFGMVCELVDSLTEWCVSHDRRKAPRNDDSRPQLPGGPGVSVEHEPRKGIGGEYQGPDAQAGDGPVCSWCKAPADVMAGDCALCRGCLVEVGQEETWLPQRRGN